MVIAHTAAQQRGHWAEQRSHAYLEAAGMRVIAYNYLSAFVEIDVIAADSHEKMPNLVFFEVRYRRSKRFGGAAVSVTSQKQRKILLTAQDFLQNYPQRNSGGNYL